MKFQAINLYVWPMTEELPQAHLDMQTNMEMQKCSYGHADMDIELHDLGLVGRTWNNRFSMILKGFLLSMLFSRISVGFLTITIV